MSVGCPGRTPSVPGGPIGLAIAGAAIVVFSSLHIAGMVGLRKLVMFFLGGSYDFHLSVATVIYEFRKDVITCVLIGSSLWLIENRGEAQPAQTPLPPATPHPPPTARPPTG